MSCFILVSSFLFSFADVASDFKIVTTTTSMKITCPRQLAPAPCRPEGPRVRLAPKPAVCEVGISPNIFTTAWPLFLAQSRNFHLGVWNNKVHRSFLSYTHGTLFWSLHQTLGPPHLDITSDHSRSDRFFPLPFWWSHGFQFSQFWILGYLLAFQQQSSLPPDSSPSLLAHVQFITRWPKWLFK